MKKLLIITSVVVFALVACSRKAEDFDSRVKGAEAHIGLGDYLAAVNEYEAIASDCGDDTRRAALLLRIADLKATGLQNPQHAIEAYSRVIAASPLTEAARVAREKRAHLKERGGDNEGAIADYSALLKHFGEGERGRLYRIEVAGVYLAMRDYGQARVEIRPLFKEKEISKGVLEKAIFLAAESYFLEGKPKKASGYYRWLLEEFADSELAPEAKLHLATCYEEMGYLGVAGHVTKSAAEDYPNASVIKARLDSLSARGKVETKPLEGVEGMSSPELKEGGKGGRRPTPHAKSSLQTKAPPLASRNSNNSGK